MAFLYVSATYRYRKAASSPAAARRRYNRAPGRPDTWRSNCGRAQLARRRPRDRGLAASASAAPARRRRSTFRRRPSPKRRPRPPEQEAAWSRAAAPEPADPDGGGARADGGRRRSPKPRPIPTASPAGGPQAHHRHPVRRPRRTCTPRTLQEASASERERRAGADAPVAVITNQNLAELAEGGQITILGAPGDGARQQPRAAPVRQRSGSRDRDAPRSGRRRAVEHGTTAGATRGRHRLGGADRGVLARPGAQDPPRLESRGRGSRPAPGARWPTCAAASTRKTILSTATTRSSRPGIARSIACRRPRPTPRRRSASSPASSRKAAEAGALPGWLREGVEFEPPATADHSPAERRRTDDPWEPKVLEEEPRDP